MCMKYKYCGVLDGKHSKLDEEIQNCAKVFFISRVNPVLLPGCSS